MRRWILFVAISGLVAGCDLGERGNEEEDPSVTFSEYPAFAEDVRKSGSLTLYEGLPHQNFDKEVFDAEVDSKDTIEIEGYRFYADPLELREGDAGWLKEVYTDPETFIPFGGYKLCGGFHPDYCLVWRNGEEETIVQICFGCHEMKSFGEGRFLYCDIRDAAYIKLQGRLKKYRKSRPYPLPNGKKLYSNCAACHGGSGKGTPGLFPPFAGNERLLAEDATYAVLVVLKGMTGPVEVGGQRFNSICPPWGEALRDAEIAAVLNYIRSENDWHEERTAPAITAEEVEKVRESVKGKKESWTFEELKAETGELKR